MPEGVVRRCSATAAGWLRYSDEGVCFFDDPLNLHACGRHQGTVSGSE